MHDDDYDGESGPFHPLIILVCALAWAMVIIIASVGPWLLVGQAWAHESMGHMKYDGWCCNGNSHTGDCQEIPDSAVKTIPGGYQITLKPGDHRLVTRVHVWQKPQTETRWSTDGRFHACLYPNEDTLRCFYAPPPSF